MTNMAAVEAELEILVMGEGKAAAPWAEEDPRRRELEEWHPAWAVEEESSEEEEGAGDAGQALAALAGSDAGEAAVDMPPFPANGAYSDEQEAVNSRSPETRDLGEVMQDLFPDEDNDSSSDYGSHDRPGTVLLHLVPDGNSLFPFIFQTNQLLFYERFKAYQDYILADCKPSEVREFTAEYLEKVLEPSGWQAIWRTDIFEVLVEVDDVEYSTLKAVVHLSEPFTCESRVNTFTKECMKELLEAKECVPLQELFVVFDESGEFDQTALAIEHVRFFFQHIWRSWDEEDEDDFDYFVRCVEPRLRMSIWLKPLSLPLSSATL